MNKIKYIGCFFEKELIEKSTELQKHERLFRIIENPHITFHYRPAIIPYELFGETVSVNVIGYGRNSENEAFEIEFTNLPESLTALAKRIKKPHITISVSKKGEAVNSGDLEFLPIPPFSIQGVFGGMTEDGIVCTKPKCM